MATTVGVLQWSRTPTSAMQPIKWIWDQDVLPLKNLFPSFHTVTQCEWSCYYIVKWKVAWVRGGGGGDICIVVRRFVLNE